MVDALRSALPRRRGVGGAAGQGRSQLQPGGLGGQRSREAADGLPAQTPGGFNPFQIWQAAPNAVVLAQTGEAPLWRRWLRHATKLWNTAVRSAPDRVAAAS